MPELPEFLANFLEPRFSKEVRIEKIEQLDSKLRKIEFQGEKLIGHRFRPGQEIEFRVSPRCFRHYTPSSFDSERGRFEVLFYLHDLGPGSKWAQARKEGEIVKVMGPGGKLSLREASRQVFLGDESALGLFVCLSQAITQGHTKARVLGALELESGTESWPEKVSAPLDAVTRQAKRGTALIEWLQRASIEIESKTPTQFYLVGHAASIVNLRKFLLGRGWPKKSILSRAYWADGKTGL